MFKESCSTDFQQFLLFCFNVFIYFYARSQTLIL
jgi:hypothetical protein